MQRDAAHWNRVWFDFTQCLQLGREEMKTFRDDLASLPGFRWHAYSSCILRRTRPLCDRFYDYARIHESYISVALLYLIFSSLAENVNLTIVFSVARH